MGEISGWAWNSINLDFFAGKKNIDFRDYGLYLRFFLMSFRVWFEELFSHLFEDFMELLLDIVELNTSQ